MEGPKPPQRSCHFAICRQGPAVGVPGNLPLVRPLTRYQAVLPWRQRKDYCGKPTRCGDLARHTRRIIELASSDTQKGSLRRHADDFDKQAGLLESEAAHAKTLPQERARLL
jgi:hypothetical protein